MAHSKIVVSKLTYDTECASIRNGTLQSFSWKIVLMQTLPRFSMRTSSFLLLLATSACALNKNSTPAPRTASQMKVEREVNDCADKHFAAIVVDNQTMHNLRLYATRGYPSLTNRLRGGDISSHAQEMVICIDTSHLTHDRRLALGVDDGVGTEIPPFYDSSPWPELSKGRALKVTITGNHDEVTMISFMPYVP